MGRGRRLHRAPVALNRGVPARGIGAALVALLLSAPRPAGAAAEAAAPAPAVPTPATALPPPLGDPRPLRAAAEEALIIGGGFALYLAHPSDTAAPDGRYGPLDKLFRGAVSFDANEGFTNFVGHPLAGTAYYLVARGNRLAAWQASLYAAASATTWELVEFHEKASINDLVVTPVAGIALGEAAAQLSAFLDRRSASGADRALAWVFQPAGKLHERIDGLAPQAGGALPWHRLAFSAAGGAVQRGAAWAPALSLGLSTRIVHGAGYGEAGRDGRALLDGNDTRLAAEATFGGGGLAESHLAAQALLAGWYARDLSDDGRGLRGQDLLLDLGTAFESDFRDWGGPGRIDWLSRVQVPGVEAAWRVFLGELRVEARARAALTFGGVLSFPLAADPAAVPPEQLPTVTRAYQYYFALGWALSPAVELRLGPVAVAGAARLERLRGLGGHDPAPVPGVAPVALADAISTFSASARWRTPLPRLAVDASFERAAREGSAGEAHRSATASRALLGVSLSL